MDSDLIQWYWVAMNLLCGLIVSVSNRILPKASVKGSSQDAKPHFCERCQELKLEELLRRGVGNVEILTFERGQKIVQDQDCPFCRALDFVYPSLNQRPDTERSCKLMLVRQQNTHPGGGQLLKEPCPNGSFYISFLPVSKDDYEFMLWNRGSRYFSCFGWDQVGYLAERQVIEEDTKSLSSDYITPYVNLRICRTWIDDCKAKQKEECLAEPGSVEGLKLIDCMSRTIINQPDEKTKYVALSYVWGSSISNPDLEWRDGPIPLPEDIPTTITDALIVTKRLGVQYLWVDRFCIEQQPPENRKAVKYHQIVNMHKIYGGAYVTIIAAAGDGPQYGLPGISARLRHPFRLLMGDRMLEATLAAPKALIDASKWSTRAWTYQEGLLSKRRLVFTDQQVYFQCRCMGIFEASEKAQVEREPVKLLSDSPVSPHFQLNMGQGTRVTAWDRIMRYSRLDLTKPEDILNGMLGILQEYQNISDDHFEVNPQRHKPYVPRMRHISGLPIEIHTSKRIQWITAIGRNLAWTTLGSGDRRPRFPSWSWTGWTHKEFDGFDNPWCLESTHSLDFCVTVEMDGGALIEGKELEEKLSTKHDFSKVKILHLKAPSLIAELISRPIKFHEFDSLQHWTRYHNTDQIAVSYEGAQGSYPLSLTDLSILSSRQKMTGIVLDEHLGTSTPEYASDNGAAMVLLVVKKHNCFERVGVSYIDRVDLKIAGKTKGQFSIG